MPMSIRKHHRAPDLTARGSHQLPMGTVPFCLTVNHAETSQSQARGGLSLTSPPLWQTGAGNGTQVFGCKKPNTGRRIRNIPPQATEPQTHVRAQTFVLSSSEPCHGPTFISYQNRQINARSSKTAQTQQLAEPGSHRDEGGEPTGLCPPGLPPAGTGGSEAGWSLSVAALPLSDPKIKPKEISKNQWYLTQPTQGKHPLWRYLGFLHGARGNFSYGKCVSKTRLVTTLLPPNKLWH